MTRPSRILVVEDEENIAEGLLINLEAEGYQVTLAVDGMEALRVARAGAFDLLILDVMLPSLSGFEICEALRKEHSRVPVLFLTARGRTEDRVLGLDLGGDDYLTKPFRLDELLGRVRALLRRQGWYRETQRPDGVVRIGAAEVDFGSGRVRARGRDDQLTHKELALLKVLVEKKGETVTRSELIDRCWGPDELPTKRTIDNFILRLRRRLEPDTRFPRHLVTVFGQGYRYVE